MITGLKDKYSSFDTNITSMKSKYDVDTYKNTFQYINDAATKLQSLINSLDDMDSHVRSGSITTYNSLDSTFISNYEAAYAELENTRNNINIFNELDAQLRNLNTNDPNYNINNYNLTLKRNECGDIIYSSFDSIRKKINILYDCLDKGIINA